MGVPVNMVNCTVKHAVKLVRRGSTLVPTKTTAMRAYAVASYKKRYCRLRPSTSSVRR